MLADLLHVVELPAWPAWSDCCTRSACRPVVAMLCLVAARRGAALPWSAGALRRAVDLVALVSVVGLLHQVEPLALPVVELGVWLAVELLHLVRIGGRWWLSCGIRSSW